MSLEIHLLAHDKDAWHLELHNIFFRLHLHFPVVQPLRQLQWICPWPPYKESNCTAFLTLISVLSGTSKIVNSCPWIFSIWFRLKSSLITPTVVPILYPFTVLSTMIPLMFLQSIGPQSTLGTGIIMLSFLLLGSVVQIGLFS